MNDIVVSRALAILRAITGILPDYGDTEWAKALVLAVCSLLYQMHSDSHIHKMVSEALATLNGHKQFVRQ